MYSEERPHGKLLVHFDEPWRHEIGETVMLEVPVFYHGPSGVRAGSVWIGAGEPPESAITEARFWATNIERSMP